MNEILKFRLNRFQNPHKPLYGLLLVLLGSLSFAPGLFAQCTPTSASLCASGDDLTTVYVGGSLLGTFNYAGAPGTNGAGNPTCMTVSTALLTGSQVCLAVETQNTNPEDVFSSWDLDITCSGGNHSEITSSGSGISVDYVSSGNPAPTPVNDGSGNSWTNPNFSNGWTTMDCAVTASTWANPIYNPVTGKVIPFIANNCSGDYSTSNTDGALFWKQCTTIPAPQPTLGPPNFTITKSLSSAMTNSGGVSSRLQHRGLQFRNAGDERPHHGVGQHIDQHLRHGHTRKQLRKLPVPMLGIWGRL